LLIGLGLQDGWIKSRLRSQNGKQENHRNRQQNDDLLSVGPFRWTTWSGIHHVESGSEVKSADRTTPLVVIIDAGERSADPG
jgi:hypothetical protein